MAKCIGVHSSVAAVKPLKVSSPDFTAPDRSAAVEDSASVYATVAQATAAYAAMANRRTPSCMGSLGAAALQTSIQAEAGHGAVVDSISIGPLPAGAVAAHETGFVVHIPLTLERQEPDHRQHPGRLPEGQRAPAADLQRQRGALHAARAGAPAPASPPDTHERAHAPGATVSGTARTKWSGCRGGGVGTLPDGCTTARTGHLTASRTGHT